MKGEQVDFEHRGLKCRLVQQKMSGATAYLGIYPDLACLSGWWCGYVDLPESHPLHGKHYREIVGSWAVSVHGGLTYTEATDDGAWRLGFDTAHHGDTPDEWTLEATMEETKRLADQLIDGLRVKRFAAGG